MTQRATTTCPSCGTQGSGKFCNQCGAPLGGARCRSCSSPLAAGARFCNECGTPAGAAGARPAPSADAGGGSSWIPWTVAGMLLVGVTAYFLAQSAKTEEAPAGMPGGAVAPFANGGGGGAPPDISQMSPRERAGRLYDRIMRYAEEGKRDSLQTFAPMALGSYESLGAEMDLDARYDYGRVAQEVGTPEIAAAQADTILKAAPSHLLGLALAARTAEMQNKKSDAAGYWKRFLAAKDAELKKNLTEYQAHSADIERAAELAKGK